MIRLKESILIEKPLDYVFRYISDFSHIQDWDPGVVSSSGVHREKPGMGSQYNLVLKFGPFRINNAGALFNERKYTQKG